MINTPCGHAVFTDDVLVEVLAGAYAQKEAAPRHRTESRSGLRDDRRMDAEERTGDARPQLDSACVSRDPTERAPDEAALPLPVDPRVEVVRDEGEREARFFGLRAMTNQFSGFMFLAR
jgi:hypothetical protein